MYDSISDFLPCHAHGVLIGVILTVVDPAKHGEGIVTLYYKRFNGTYQLGGM